MLEAWISALPWGVLTTSAEGAPARADRDARRADEPARRVPRGGRLLVGGDRDARRRRVRRARRGHRPPGAGRPTPGSRRCAARQANEDELEAIVGDWTSTRGRDDAVAALVAPASRPHRSARWTRSPRPTHLRGRGFFVTLEHPEAGTRAVAGPPWHPSRHPMRPVRPAPTARPAHRRGPARRARHGRRRARRPHGARHRRVAGPRLGTTPEIWATSRSATSRVGAQVERRRWPGTTGG